MRNNAPRPPLPARNRRRKRKEEKGAALVAEISVDKLTSNRILLRGGGGGGKGRRGRGKGELDAKKGDRKQVRSRLERAATISCFSSGVSDAPLSLRHLPDKPRAPPSSWIRHIYSFGVYKGTRPPYSHLSLLLLPLQTRPFLPIRNSKGPGRETSTCCNPIGVEISSRRGPKGLPGPTLSPSPILRVRRTKG